MCVCVVHPGRLLADTHRNQMDSVLLSVGHGHEGLALDSNPQL